MTLREFFDLLANNPGYLLAFFLLIPFTALLAGWLGKDEGHEIPWKYLYSALVYLITIPGIFAITLSIYLFLFERQSIFDTDLYTQILPVASMIVTLFIIRKNVDLKHVPGFDKLSGLVIMLTAIIAVMWLLEKTRIIAVTIIPFSTFVIIFIVILVMVRFGWSRMVRS